jgi:hypothetical protein
MNPSGGGNDSSYGVGGTYYGGELVQSTGDAQRGGRNADQDSGDEFMTEMAKIRQNQAAESAPATGKYKQKLEEARRATVDEPDNGYKYPGYKARRRESLSADETPVVSAHDPPSGGSSSPPLPSSSPPLLFCFFLCTDAHATSSRSFFGVDVFSQVRTRRQEDLLKAARTRKKTKEKKKAFGDQIKGVLAYLPFRTSHLSGFDG